MLNNDVVLGAKVVVFINALDVVLKTLGNGVVEGGDGNIGGIKLFTVLVKFVRLVEVEKLETVWKELDIQKDKILFDQKTVQLTGKWLEESHIKI